MPEPNERPVKYTIQFQYKPKGHQRSLDYAQEENIEFTPGDPLPLPGDSVILTLQQGGRKMYKVLTRNFAYQGEPDTDIVQFCWINIVVTDIDEDDELARLKE